MAGSPKVTVADAHARGASERESVDRIARPDQQFSIRPTSHASRVDVVLTLADDHGNIPHQAEAVSRETDEAPISPSGTDGFTLEFLEEWALSSNPSVQQARLAAAKAVGVWNQVGLKPNPTLSYFADEMGNEGTAGLHGASIATTIVRGGKLRWNRQVIRHDVDAMRWLEETQRQRLRTDIRLVFYDALAAQKRLTLASEFRQVVEKGVKLSEDRLRANEGTRPDVLQSSIQLNEIDLTIQQATFDYSAARRELATLVGVEELGDTPLIGDLRSDQSSRDIETEFAKIVAASPWLAAAEARVDRARANLRRQRQQPIPNLSAQLGVGHDHATGDEFANVQLSLPIPIHNKNQGNVQAAHAEYCEAVQNVQRIRLSIRRDLVRAMRDFQVAKTIVQRYEQTILPNAAEVLELMFAAHSVGEYDFLRVLTARRSYFDANLTYVAALGQLAQANTKIDNLLLAGGLSNVASYDGDDGLRDQALSSM